MLKVISFITTVIISFFCVLHGLAFFASDDRLLEILKSRADKNLNTAQIALVENRLAEKKLVVVGDYKFLTRFKSIGRCERQRLDVPVNRLSWKDLNQISNHLPHVDPDFLIIQMKPELRTNLRASWAQQRFDAIKIMGKETELLPIKRAKLFVDSILERVVSQQNKQKYEMSKISIQPNTLAELNPRHIATNRNLKHLQLEKKTKIVWFIDEPDFQTEIHPDVFQNILASNLNALTGVKSSRLPASLENCLSERDFSYKEITHFWKTQAQNFDSDFLSEIVLANTRGVAQNYQSLINFIGSQGLKIGKPIDLIHQNLQESNVYIRYDIHPRDFFVVPTLSNINRQNKVNAAYYLQWRETKNDVYITQNLDKFKRWIGKEDEVGLHHSPINSLIFYQGTPTPFEQQFSEEKVVASLDKFTSSIREAALSNTIDVLRDFRSTFPEGRLVSVHGSGWNQKLKKLCRLNDVCPKKYREGPFLREMQLDELDVIVPEFFENVRNLTDTLGTLRLLCKLQEKQSKPTILLLHPARFIRDRANYAEAVQNFNPSSCKSS